MNLTKRHARGRMRAREWSWTEFLRPTYDGFVTRTASAYRPIPGALGCGRPGASGLLCLRKEPRRQRSSRDGPREDNETS